MLERDLNTLNIHIITKLFGPLDINIRIIENEFDVRVVNRGDDIKITSDSSESISQVVEVIHHLERLYSLNDVIDEKNINYYMEGCCKVSFRNNVRANAYYIYYEI